LKAVVILLHQKMIMHNAQFLLLMESG